MSHSHNGLGYATLAMAPSSTKKHTKNAKKKAAQIDLKNASN
jgi:hypothetical protein